MTLWHVVLIASAVTFGLKLSGYLVPARFVESPRAVRSANLLTVALLAALVAVQTIGQGAAIVVDARIPALLVAAVLFWRKVPFVVVIAAAAVTAALIRLL